MTRVPGTWMRDDETGPAEHATSGSFPLILILRCGGGCRRAVDLG